MTTKFDNAVDAPLPASVIEVINRLACEVYKNGMRLDGVSLHRVHTQYQQEFQMATSAGYVTVTKVE